MKTKATETTRQVEDSRDSPDRELECLLHLLPDHRVQFGRLSPVEEGGVEVVRGLGKGKGVDGIQLLPVGEPCLEDLVNGALDLLPQVLHRAMSWPPHFNAQVAVGVFPLQCRDALVSKLGRVGFHIATPGTGVDDGKTPALPDIEREAGPQRELVDYLQQMFQLAFGGGEKREVVGVRQLLNSSTVLEGVAGRLLVKSREEGLKCKVEEEGAEWASLLDARWSGLPQSIIHPVWTR